MSCHRLFLWFAFSLVCNFVFCAFFPSRPNKTILTIQTIIRTKYDKAVEESDYLRRTSLNSATTSQEAWNQAAVKRRLHTNYKSEENSGAKASATIADTLAAAHQDYAWWGHRYFKTQFSPVLSLAQKVPYSPPNPIVKREGPSDKKIVFSLWWKSSRKRIV